MKRAVLPVVLLAALGAVYLFRPRSKDEVRTRKEPARSTRSTPREESPRPTAVKNETSNTSSVVDRLLAARHPADLARIADGSIRLTDQDIERLRALVCGGSQAHRMIAARILASLKDPGGGNFAALRDAATDSDPAVAHAALSALKTYARNNPSADVAGHLLNIASSSTDIETRTVAIGAIAFESLKDDALQRFVTLFRDPSEEIRIAAVETAAASRAPGAVKALVSAFEIEADAGLRGRILEALEEMDTDEAREALAGLGK